MGISIYLLVHPRQPPDRGKSLAVIGAAVALLALAMSPGVGLLALALAAFV